MQLPGDPAALSSYLEMPIKQWCALCDALDLPPDVPVDRMIKRALRVTDQARTFRRLSHREDPEIPERQKGERQ